MSKNNIVDGYIKRYERAKALEIDLVEMDPSSLAGYYLQNYADAEGAITIDIAEGRIPFTNGTTAKTLIANIKEAL